jgi:hypothetical protein
MEYFHAPKEMLTEDFLKNLHAATFNYKVDGDDFRIDGAFFAKEKETLFGYILYKELNKSEVELLYGGVTEVDRGYKTLKTYRNFLELLFKKYDYIETYVVNTNYKMLKLYMALEFNIVGVKQSKYSKTLVALSKKGAINA